MPSPRAPFATGGQLRPALRGCRSFTSESKLGSSRAEEQEPGESQSVNDPAASVIACGGMGRNNMTAGDARELVSGPGFSVGGLLAPKRADRGWERRMKGVGQQLGVDEKIKMSRYKLTCDFSFCCLLFPRFIFGGIS